MSGLVILVWAHARKCAGRGWLIYFHSVVTARTVTPLFCLVLMKAPTVGVFKREWWGGAVHSGFLNIKKEQLISLLFHLLSTQ